MDVKKVALNLPLRVEIEGVGKCWVTFRPVVFGRFTVVLPSMSQSFTFKKCFKEIKPRGMVMFLN